MKEYTLKDMTRLFRKNLEELSRVANVSSITFKKIFVKDSNLAKYSAEDIIHALKKENERLYKEDVVRICEDYRERLRLINYIAQERECYGSTKVF